MGDERMADSHDYRTGRAVITLQYVNDSLLLLFARDRKSGARRRGEATLALVHWAAIQSAAIRPSVRRFSSPRRATAATTRMSPQLIGLIALLTASRLLALLVFVRRHQRRSRRLRAAALGLQPSPSPDGDAPLSTRHLSA
jgi:hypothetical protein